MSAGMRILVLGLAGAAALSLAGCGTTGGFMKGEPASFQACETQKVEIYFEPNSAEVNTYAKQALAEAAKSAKGCKSNGVDVLGLADSVGDPDANLALSERRATAVTGVLKKLGMRDVRIAAAGATGATTARGEAKPLRRRTEVVFNLAKP